MTTMRLFCAFMLSLAAMQPHVAQHLLDALNEGVQEPTLPVTATFKDTRIVNVQQRNAG